MPVPNFPPLASALKRQAPALPSPEAPPPPPPPPKVVAAPPPPPPAPALQVATDATTYDPRDRVFYHRAVVLFIGALRPASRVFHYEKGPDGKPVTPVDHDREQAKEAAHVCAGVLDRGIVPKGFVLPDILTLEGLIRDREILDAATRKETLSYAQGHSVPNPQHYAAPNLYPPTVTEGQKAKMRERIEAVGTVPSRPEAAAENERKLRGLSDISETVRSHALDAAVARITSRKDLTGAPTCRQDVVGIVVDAILDSIEAANQLGLPSRDALSYSEEENEAFGTHAFPYGAHIAADLAIARDEMLAVKLNLVPPPDSDEPSPDTNRPGQQA